MEVLETATSVCVAGGISVARGWSEVKQGIGRNGRNARLDLVTWTCIGLDGKDVHV